MHDALRILPDHGRRGVRATGKAKYVAGAAEALRYSLSQQQVPDTAGQPHGDDPTSHRGFWSWDLPYDYTM